MNEERMRQLYGRGIAGRDARSQLAGACAVEPERLLALVRHELPEEERLALLDQVMASSACREAFELLRVVDAAGRATGGTPSSGLTIGNGPVARARTDHDEGQPSAPAAPAAPPPGDGGVAPPALASGASGVPWWRRGGATMALAACALLAVGLMTRGRGAGEAEATRGAAGDAVVLVSPDTDPPAGAPPPSSFVWHAVPGAARYEFELLGADGEPLHQATTGDTVLALPPDVTLRAGTDYRWLVRAITAGGTRRSSPARPLRLPAR